MLAGLSAALPRVVDAERLVIGQLPLPDRGTLAATAGGGAGLRGPALVAGPDSDAAVVLLGAVLYLCAGLSALRIGRGPAGARPSGTQPRLRAALAGTGRGLVGGLRHLLAAARGTRPGR